MIIAAFAGMLILCIFSAAALEGARQGLWLWAGTVAPALLPFLVVTSMLQSMGAMQWLGKPLQKVMQRVFRCPPSAAGIFLSGALSGYPVNARLIGQAVEAGELTREDATRMASFCIVTGPSFIVASVGLGMLSDAGAGWRMLIAHDVAALTAGVLFCRFYKAKANAATSPSPSPAPTAQSGLATMMTALGSAGGALLAVGATMGFFGALIQILLQSGALQALSGFFRLPLSLLGLTESLHQPLLEGLVEMTTGCKSAAAAGAPIEMSGPLCAALISFGALSVLTQSLYFLKDAVDKRTFLLQRVLHAVLTYLLALILFRVG